MENCFGQPVFYKSFRFAIAEQLTIMIAITGANGLLGSHLLRKFVAENEPVVAIKKKDSPLHLVGDRMHITWKEADVLDPDSLAEAFEGCHTVIHTAAQVSFNPRMRKKIFLVNEEGTKNVVNTCLVRQVKNLIHVSSVAALGRQKGIRHMNEESRWQDSDLNTDYARSKYAAELEVWRGHEEGLRVAVVNPSVILAPGDATKSSAQFFLYVLKEKIFYTDGQLNYVDVRDVVDMIWIIYKKECYGERYIANSGHTSFQNLLQQIATRLKKRAPLVKVSPALLYWIGLAEEWRCRLTGSEPMITTQAAKLVKELFYYSNQKVRQTLGMEFRSLETTLDWCCAHYLNAYKHNK
jgi:dihydroflavonol-4-reductase